MNALIAGLLESPLAEPMLLLVKATLLLAVASGTTLLLRRRDAAARHLVWTLTLVMLLVMPVAAFTIPDWRIPVLTMPAEAGSDVQPGGFRSTSLVPAPNVAEPTTEASGAVAGSNDESVWPRVVTRRGLVLIWALGAAAVLAWLVVGRVALRAVQRRSPPLTGTAWEEARRDAAWLLEVRRPVRLYRSRSATMPVTWGVLRPVVLLPEEAETWTADRRRIVLLHELSHVARWDCLTQLLAGVACALYWFHPGVWYAARRMRVEREHACDDLVLSAGTPAPDYATHLLQLAQRYRAVFPAPMVALHMARPKQLEGRLLTVLSGPSGRRPPTRRRVAVAAAATALLTLPLSALQPAASRSPQSAEDAPLSADVTAAETNEATAAAEADAAIDAIVRDADDVVRDSVIERDVSARAGETLVLDLRTGGTVEITSWDEDRVRVRARLSGQNWRESAVSVQRSANGVDVVAWQNDDSRYSTSHTFDIRVPRRFNVQLASQGGGVTIRNVEGRFRGHTNGGELLLSQVKGEAMLSTTGGDIRVSDSVLDGRVTTGAGAVTLINVSGDLRGGSSGQAQAAEPRTQDRPTRAQGSRTEDARAQTPSRNPQRPRDGGSITINDADSIARIVRRLPLSAAAHSLVTRDGHVALLLRDSTIVLQLTDRGLEDIGSGDVASEDDGGFLTALVGSMLRGGLRMLLDRGIEYSLSDLREARYESGRLVLESRDGDDVFGDVSVSGGKVMEGFDPRQARAFASRVNTARARVRR